ncbi:MAG: hypothetical protein ACREJB_05145 [Planctomycetaceae bacterium]
MTDDIADEIQAAAAKKILFLPHAIRQMVRPDRMITVEADYLAIITTDLPDPAQWSADFRTRI